MQGSTVRNSARTVAALLLVALGIVAPNVAYSASAGSSEPPPDPTPTTEETIATTVPPSTEEPVPSSEPTVPSTEEPVPSSEPPDTEPPTDSAPPSTDSVPPSSTEDTVPPSTEETVPPSTEVTTLEASDSMLLLAAAVPPPTCSVRILARAGTGGHVAACVETRLAQLGYPTAPNAFIDDVEAAKIGDFQASQGLPRTNQADPTTLSRMGIYSAPPGPPCTVRIAIRAGARGHVAACMERRLAQLGLNSAPNNFIDDVEAAAIGDFQYSAFLPQNNRADATTLSRMGIYAAPPAPTCSVSILTRAGTNGNTAGCVERRLAQLGLNATPNNFIDDVEAAAIGDFQYAAFLPQNNEADPTTLYFMGIWKDLPAPSCLVRVSVRAGTSGPSASCVEQRLGQLGLLVTANGFIDDVEAAQIGDVQYGGHLRHTNVADPFTLFLMGIWSGPPPISCTVGATFGAGATSVDVSCVETRLWELLLRSDGADGFFDEGARQALAQFQYANNLAPTGLADVATLRALGVWRGGDANHPLPANSGTGRRIVYSRAQQRIWLVEADGTVTNTHAVSGRLYEPYAGTYSVYSRSEYTYSANDPSVRWRYMVRFAYGPGGGRIGFHEIPNRNGRPLQTKEQLGLPLSGGCVRQTTEDAILVWNWAPIGTKVVVL